MTDSKRLVYINSQYKSLDGARGSQKKIRGELATFFAVLGQPVEFYYLPRSIDVDFFKRSLSLRNFRNSIVYFRNVGYHFLLLVPVLSALKKNGSVLVIEIPTPLSAYRSEGAEFHGKSIRFMLKRLAMRLTFPGIYRYFDIVIFRATESRRYTPERQDNILLMGNGIDVSGIPLHRCSSKSLELISVSNNQRKHGYDRLLRGIAAYSNLDDQRVPIHYHCVGLGSDLDRLKNMVIQLGISSNVTFYGQLDGKALDDVFDKANLAVGPLAIHRVGLKDSSALKTREYLARGLPVIGNPDIDLAEDVGFYLTINQAEAPIEIENIVRFFIETKRKYTPEDIRRYASNHLDMNVKVRIIMDRIEAMRS